MIQLKKRNGGIFESRRAGSGRPWMLEYSKVDALLVGLHAPRYRISFVDPNPSYDVALTALASALVLPRLKESEVHFTMYLEPFESTRARTRTTHFRGQKEL